MLNFLHLLPVSLLFTVCVLILCPSCLAYTASFYPTNIPLMKQFQQFQPGQFTGRSNYDDTIRSIFKFGPENGIVLFNTNPKSHNFMHADAEMAASNTNPTINQEQPFKVQRSPDGKLNLVFNDFLIFQTTTKAPIAANRNSGASNSWSTSPVTNTANINRNDSNECKGKRDGKTFCINVPNYDQVTQLNEINKEEFSQFEALFGEDVVELPNITQRMSGEPDDLYHCSSKAKTIFPQKGETRDAGWMYIVNNDQYKQGILVEICENEGKTCNFSDTLPNQYTSSCKQHYIYRVLVAVAPNKTMTKQHFKIPSCCKCAIKQRVFI